MTRDTLRRDSHYVGFEWGLPYYDILYATKLNYESFDIPVEELEKEISCNRILVVYLVISVACRVSMR